MSYESKTIWTGDSSVGWSAGSGGARVGCSDDDVAETKHLRVFFVLKYK